MVLPCYLVYGMLFLDTESAQKGFPFMVYQNKECVVDEL